MPSHPKALLSSAIGLCVVCLVGVMHSMYCSVVCSELRQGARRSKPAPAWPGMSPPRAVANALCDMGHIEADRDTNGTAPSWLRPVIASNVRTVSAHGERRRDEAPPLLFVTVTDAPHAGRGRRSASPRTPPGAGSAVIIARNCGSAPPNAGNDNPPHRPKRHARTHPPTDEPHDALGVCRGGGARAGPTVDGDDCSPLHPPKTTPELR